MEIQAGSVTFATLISAFVAMSRRTAMVINLNEVFLTQKNILRIASSLPYSCSSGMCWNKLV